MFAAIGARTSPPLLAVLVAPPLVVVVAVAVAVAFAPHAATSLDILALLRVCLLRLFNFT